MSLKQPQLTQPRITPVIEPRFQIKFDLPVFLPFKTIIMCKIKVVQPPAYQAPAYQAPAPQIQAVSRDFQAYEDLKGITTRSGVAYKGPTIPITSSPKVMERKTEVTMDTMPPANNGSSEDVPPSVIPVIHHESISEPANAPVISKLALRMPVLMQIRLDSKNFNRKQEKLSDMARTHGMRNCSAVILHKVTKEIGDPGRFLIHVYYPRINTCNAWRSWPQALILCISCLEIFSSELNPILHDARVIRFYSRRFGARPGVPLILGRSFLKTSRALIDVYEGEITLRVGREAITFNLDQTSRYTADYNHMTANRIDVIDMACEEYSQEVLGFSNVISKADSFLALEDDPTSPEVDPTYYDPEGDILLLKAILNSEPSPPLQGNYFPETQKDLKICKANNEKSSNEEKAALIEVLKSHKRAIAWKLSDIKGINPEFCTYKILMEEDYEPTVQHQRRVNPKIHDVIKKEVEKLLDAGLIYPISDSPGIAGALCTEMGGMDRREECEI
ncbi:hypothetical protein Tco_0468308 [Tanacetum coccineum]